MILKVIKWALLYIYGVIEYLYVSLIVWLYLDEHICMCLIFIEITKYMYMYLFLTKVYKL